MTDADTDTIVNALRQALPDANAPPFAELMANAERRHAAQRRLRFASAATVLLGLAGLTVWQMSEQASVPTQALANDLMHTTQWSAPSDVLLPRRSTDIYSELPAWPVSTNSEEGTLL